MITVITPERTGFRFQRAYRFRASRDKARLGEIFTYIAEKLGERFKEQQASEMKIELFAYDKDNIILDLITARISFDLTESVDIGVRN
jgi:hypothetical protein